MKKILAYAAAGMTLCAVLLPFALTGSSAKPVARSGVRIDPVYTGGRLYRVIDRGGYNIEVNYPVNPLQRAEPYVQPAWSPASAQPARVADEAGRGSFSAAIARVGQRVVPRAPLAATYRPRILVFGHRGARSVAPENTMPAFETAIRAGADSLELDLAVTRDDVLVVSHDPDLKPPICIGPRDRAIIRELTLSEARQWDCGAARNPAFPRQQPVPGTRMPALDEVLALAPRGGFSFTIEIKSFPKRPEVTPPPAAFAKLVIDAVRRHKLEARAIVQSFDFRTLVEMKRQAPDIRLAALYNGPARDFQEIAKEGGGAQIVAPEFKLVTAARVEAAHRAGLQVVPWTPNTREAWEALVAAGVDGIITDDPEGLVAWLKEKGLR
jgi:glycerophosphoryl diester phosphodiesterase